jgi:hypothetical protein
MPRRVGSPNALVIADTVAVKAPDAMVLGGALGGFAATPVFYLST